MSKLVSCRIVHFPIFGPRLQHIFRLSSTKFTGCWMHSGGIEFRERESKERKAQRDHTVESQLDGN